MRYSKSIEDDKFIINSYFTDTVKKGELLWQRRRLFRSNVRKKEGIF